MAEEKTINNTFKSTGEGLSSSSRDGNIIKELDYRGIFSPARQEITWEDTFLHNFSAEPILTNIFKLEDYFWYPENSFQ